MMKRIGVMIVLAYYLAGIWPSFGGEVAMFEGVDGVSNQAVASGGTISGYTESGNAATLIEGAEAHACIPAGTQGNAWSRWHLSESRTATPSLNGDDFSLHAGYSGYINVGVKKNTNAGIASADARIKATACVDNSFLAFPYQALKTGVVSGSAEISSETSNTGGGSTYANADGTASYEAHAVSPMLVKKVMGSASGKAYVESKNAEDKPSPTAPLPNPSGSLSAESGIYTESNANDWKSYAKSTVYNSVSSNRGNNPGLGYIDGDIHGLAESSAWDGVTPTTLVQDPSNANAHTEAIGGFKSRANTYATDDRASADINLDSESWHNSGSPNTADINLNYNKAYGSAYSSATARRVSLNKAIPVDAINMISYSTQSVRSATFFTAYSKDNTDDSIYASTRSSAVTLRTNAHLANVDSVNANVGSELTGLHDGLSNAATVLSKARNYGPDETSSRTDYSSALGQFSGQDIDAAGTPTDLVSVDVSQANLVSFIFGSGSGGTGTAVASPAKFSIHGTGSQSTRISQGYNFWTANILAGISD
ncbi:MAG TPA: hypothetical protein VN455_11795 [Methanotrichaceae archaeon]|nr:hypothetical protein [Methanotrichaceae archaeon]